LGGLSNFIKAGAHHIRKAPSNPDIRWWSETTQVKKCQTTALHSRKRLAKEKNSGYPQANGLARVLQFRKKLKKINVPSQCTPFWL
jgi:hypothetical protein